MKPYRDVFGNKLTQRDVAGAVRVTVQHGKASPSLLQRTFKWGYGKAARITALLEDAGVVGPLTDKPRPVILKNEDAAINAALRQLRKGKRG